MTETDDTIRLKRLRFRSWHRGSREADLLFGSFADRHLATLRAAELAAYERLLDAEDPDIWDWVVNRVEPPAGQDRALIERLRGHRYRDTGA